jgi:hypothetical protein
MWKDGSGHVFISHSGGVQPSCTMVQLSHPDTCEELHEETDFLRTCCVCIRLRSAEQSLCQDKDILFVFLYSRCVTQRLANWRGSDITATICSFPHTPDSSHNALPLFLFTFADNLMVEVK